MRILLSNDDGVHAQGIKTLFKHLNAIYNVTLVAPDRNCSATSNSLTLGNPLRAEKLENGFVAVNGTPTDSVCVAVSQIFPKTFDLVVAGINHGPNLGDDTLYSGTVAAATEGRHMGMPSIAVSLNGDKYFDTAALIVVKLINRLIDKPLPQDQILNVNVPDLPIDKVKGIKVTRLGRRQKSDAMNKQQDPWGRDIYWYGLLGSELDADEGTDFHAIENGYASITPLTIDMTAYKSINNIKEWVNELSF